VGIRQILHSSFCFLNTNTVIMRQPIQTVRMLEAEWWQVCGEVWVRGQRKMSQVLGAFELLNFTMLWPVFTWWTFWNLWTIPFFNFSKFFQATVNHRLLKPWILNPWIGGSACISKCGSHVGMRLLHVVWVWYWIPENLVEHTKLGKCHDKLIGYQLPKNDCAV